MTDEQAINRIVYALAYVLDRIIFDPDSDVGDIAEAREHYEAIMLAREALTRSKTYTITPVQEER